MKKPLQWLIIFFGTAFLVLTAWSLLGERFLFHCGDRVPFLDFFPPFVHPGYFGDFYIAPAHAVYAIWIFCVVFIFALPTLIVPRRFFKQKGVFTFCVLFAVLFLALIYSTYIFAFGISSPYLWLIHLALMVLFIFSAVKINKKFGLIMAVIVITFFTLTISGAKQIFCWPKDEINGLVEVSCSSEDCSRYEFAFTDYSTENLDFNATPSTSFSLDEPPAKTITISKSLKALLDCEQNITLWQMLVEIFTKNW